MRYKAHSLECCRQRGQDQLSCSPTLRAGSPFPKPGQIYCTSLVRGRASFPTLMTLGPALLPAVFGKGHLFLACRQVTGPALPNLCPWGSPSHPPHSRVSSTMLPRRDAGPSLLSATVNPGPGFTPVSGVKGQIWKKEGISSFVHATTWKTVVGPVHLQLLQNEGPVLHSPQTEYTPGRLPRPRIGTWFLMVIDSGSCWASGSTD